MALGGNASPAVKRILLIDEDDPRRATRVMLLQQAGYEVVTTTHFEEVEQQTAGRFDLILIETADIEKATVAYGERLKLWAPKLPILMLSKAGLFLPKESLLTHFPDGHQSPTQLMAKIASLLFASTHERES